MKKILFSLVLGALSISSFADIVVMGTLTSSTSTTTNPDGSSTTSTSLSCVGDEGICVSFQCSLIDPNGNPLPGGQIILNGYQNGQNVLSQSGTLTQFQNWQDQQGNNDFYLQIWNPAQDNK